MYGVQILGSEKKAKRILWKAAIRYWDAVRQSPLTFRYQNAGDAYLALCFLEAYKVQARLVFQI